MIVLITVDTVLRLDWVRSAQIFSLKLALSPPTSYQDVTSGLGRSLESPALILYPEYFFLEKKEREGEALCFVLRDLTKFCHLC